MQKFIKGDRVKYTHPGTDSSITGIFTGVGFQGLIWLDEQILVDDKCCTLDYPASLKWEDLKGRKVAVKCNDMADIDMVRDICGANPWIVNDDYLYSLLDQFVGNSIAQSSKDLALKFEYTCIIPAGDFIAANTQLVREPEPTPWQTLLAEIDANNAAIRANLEQTKTLTNQLKKLCTTSK